MIPVFAVLFDMGRLLKNARYQMPPNFCAIVRIAGQILGEGLFFVEQPPNQPEDREDDGDEPPVGAERQRHANKIYRCARIHRISHDRVGARGDYFLLVCDLDGGGAIRVFFEYPVHHPHRDDNQDVADYGEPWWRTRPAEARVKPRNNERGDGWNPRTYHNDLLDQ